MKLQTSTIFFGLVLSSTAFSADLFKITQANLGFDSYVRVETPGKIIESDDPVQIGSALSYIESLRYTASKVLQLNRTFNSMLEIKQFAQTDLCMEVHALELKPIRENGTKASRSLNVNMKPKTILLVGSQVSNKGSPLSTNFICSK